MERQKQTDLILSRLQCASIICCEQESMARHTTFAIGGAAKYFVTPKNEEELMQSVRIARECAVPYAVLGRGSNVLVSDGGFDGMVISTLGMRHISVLQNNTDADQTPQIVAECGVSLRELALFAAEHGWRGLEFAHGIPGTVGGAVRMNAGAFEGSIGALTQKVRCYCAANDSIEIVSGEALAFAYRHSFLTDRPDLICLSATFTLPQADTESEKEERQLKIRQEMERMRQRRRATQPLEFPSAGSVFKRPRGYFAGKLIEDCHLKGTQIGGAQISEKHAGFIINRGGATAADVYALVRLIQKEVKNKFDVDLDEEIIYLDSDSDAAVE